MKMNYPYPIHQNNHHLSHQSNHPPSQQNNPPPNKQNSKTLPPAITSPPNHQSSNYNPPNENGNVTQKDNSSMIPTIVKVKNLVPAQSIKIHLLSNKNPPNLNHLYHCYSKKYSHLNTPTIISLLKESMGGKSIPIQSAKINT